MNGQNSASCATSPGGYWRAGCFVCSIVGLMSRIPDSLIALVGRFSIAAIFWKSGQTKVQGFAIDIVAGEFQLGWPDSRIRLSTCSATNTACR